MQPLMYALSVETYLPMLTNLSALLDKAAAQFGADADALVEARLAPDMFPLSRQVQIACDFAKSGSAYLSGREPPRFEDDEKTLAELKARIAKTIAYVREAPASAFEGAETRQIVQPLFQGRRLEADGLHYLKDWNLTNFYFHVTTAYAILRHKGVEIGKPDFAAHVRPLMKEPSAA
jgi:uncharacterized protein